LNRLLVAVAEAPVSFHEWSQTVSITSILWVIVVLLGAALLWYVVGDRTAIKETLDRLVKVVEDLRVDLASNYVKKIELEHLDRKVERLREHMTSRAMERRVVMDAEGDEI